MSSHRKQAAKSSRGTLLLTATAIEDVREIERHSLSRWGRKTGAKYLADIESALDRIRDNIGILRLKPEFSPGLFFYRVRQHLLIFDVDGETAILLTVLHASMDIPSRLAELEPHLIAEVEILHHRLKERSK